MAVGDCPQALGGERWPHLRVRGDRSERVQGQAVL